MVTRKPVAPAIDTSSSSKNPAPPYPETPTDAEPTTASSVYSDDLKTSPAFDLVDIPGAPTKQRRDSDVSSHGTWDSDGTEREEEDDAADGFVEVPLPLRIRSSQQNIQPDPQKDGLPSILRPGPANATRGEGVMKAPQRYEEEAESNPWRLESNNPYTKQPVVAESWQRSAESNRPIWDQPAHVPPPPPAQVDSRAEVVELPTVKTPANELAQLDLNDRPVPTPTYETAEVLPVPQQGQPPLPPVVPNEAPPLPPTNPWAGDRSQQPHLPRKDAITPKQSQQPPLYPPPPGPPPPREQETAFAPPLGPPPGHSQQLLPISTNTAAATSQEAIPETPGTRDRRQRAEHYQIKHVNWDDKGKMRQSPILTQNLNGPCPLLALVNALVLSTPPGMDTALIETLRTREQVSLGLLLDAVFDELMSGRRGETAHQLPDVGELYAFLLALHTGMNVNPRFVTPTQTPRGSYDGHPVAMKGIHPMERAQKKPGSFEETKEMKLYSTFNIPLIHGWTVPKETSIYAAFLRSAQTFEDAQNIQFAEVELLDRSRAEGLSFQEQQIREDIQTIKSFLRTWPTQLTDYGLETISTSLPPGQIAILFRNDHFSTLYKEPRSGALMTLVTDAGYSSHAEIVWESLVDVNGAASEYFSGDFRSVSHGQDPRQNQSSSSGSHQEWETVPSRIPQQQGASLEVAPPLPGPRPTLSQPGSNQPAPALSAAEQEDHDLALALQLQEEEEEQERQAEARRRRERELSEQFLSSEERPPRIPPRRNQRSPQNSSTNIPVNQRPSPQARPAVHRPGQTSDPDAPPTYEQSASDRPYRPAGATAPPTQGSPLTALDALSRPQSAYSAQQSSISVNTIGQQQDGRRASGNRIQQRRSSQLGSPNPPPRYGNQVPGAATIKDADERCVVM